MEIKTKTAAAPAAVTSTGVPYTLVFTPLENILNSKSLPLRGLNESHVKSLVVSISKAGLDNPLDVWGGEAEGKLMKLGEKTMPASFLITGNHRREALRRLASEDPKKFAAMFPQGIPNRRRVCELKDALLVQLRENVQREDMDASEILPVLKHLIELKVQQNVIANRIGKSPAWVTSMLDINKTLGDEGEEEVAKGTLSVRSANAAAKKIKSAEAKGEPVDKKAALAAAKAEEAERRQGNAKRAKKRVSLRVLFDRFTALPTTKMVLGEQLNILKGIIAYAIGESNKLPEQVKNEVAEPKTTPKIKIKLGKK